MIPRMAREIARDLKAGKTIAVIVATQKDGASYFIAAAKALGAAKARGRILILCAEENNGPTWRGHRFDAVHIDLDGASRTAKVRGQELAHEVAARTHAGPTS